MVAGYTPGVDLGRIGIWCGGPWRVDDRAAEAGEVAAELERLGYGAVLMVPVRVGSGQRALVEVYREHPQAFTSAEVDRARVVAQQFGPVLARLATT